MAAFDFVLSNSPGGGNMAKMKNDKSTWAIGGGVMIGIGVGFFFLQTSVLAFVGSILAGLGVGLVITAIISAKNRKDT